jgi:tetratricopeptide (TPR) repeat protein
VKFAIRKFKNKWIQKNMDLENPVIQLCIQGTRAELEHRPEDAWALYQQAWDIHTNDYEACIAAHYLGRFQDTAENVLQWNLIALQHANAIHDESVKDFLPSLYLSLGHSYEVLGNIVEAQKYYQLAAELGVIHQTD